MASKDFLTLLGYPEDGYNDSKRLEWIAKVGIPLGLTAIALLTAGIILAR